MMKILQSCGSRSWGGLEIMALKTSLLLRDKGFEIHIVCPENSELEKHALDHSINIIPLWKKINSVFSPARKLSELLQLEKYNVVHTHLSHDLWTLVPALKFSGSKAKLFLSKHMGSWVNKKDIFHRYLYKRVDRIFAVSEYVKQSVVKTCPVEESKVSILYPGLKLENYNPSKHNKDEIRAELGIANNSIVVGMAGRMSPGKGHEEFLEAANILRSNCGNRLRFMVVGSASYGESNYEKEILKLASQLKIDDITLFAGYRDDIPRMMAVLDIFVFPSHEESFGITLTEAMAMQIPVIASNNAGTRDIVIDNVTGLLIPPKDPSRLAEAIRTLAGDKGLRQNLGKAGRKRAEEIFNDKDELNKLEDYYAG